MKKPDILKNDTSTAKDELILFIIALIIGGAAVGIILFLDKLPELIRTPAAALSGIMIMLTIMLMVMVVYRLTQNKKK